MGPAPLDNISESASVLKTRYPERTDKFGLKFARGHRTALQLRGVRPVTRTAKRPMRGV